MWIVTQRDSDAHAAFVSMSARPVLAPNTAQPGYFISAQEYTSYNPLRQLQRQMRRIRHMEEVRNSSGNTDNTKGTDHGVTRPTSVMPQPAALLAATARRMIFLQNRCHSAAFASQRILLGKKCIVTVFFAGSAMRHCTEGL